MVASLAFTLVAHVVGSNWMGFGAVVPEPGSIRAHQGAPERVTVVSTTERWSISQMSTLGVPAWYTGAPACAKVLAPVGAAGSALTAGSKYPHISGVRRS
jgi:hypothetical protein